MKTLTFQRVRLWVLTTNIVGYLIECAHCVKHGVVLSPFIYDRRPFVQRVPINVPSVRKKVKTVSFILRSVYDGISRVIEEVI